jgi:isopenicillin N synthase-like dioxygenase
VAAMQDGLPLVDVTALRAAGDDGPVPSGVASAIDDACRRFGFFRVVGHGIAPDQLTALDRAARAFFALAESDKARIAMPLAGAAWRGWFPLGGELTDGRPDHKEGIYFGQELGPDHPAVVAGRPLHGRNLFPSEPADLRPAVLGWIKAMTALGQHLLRAVAVALGHAPAWFAVEVAADPTVLFRIFRYPPTPPSAAEHPWGVAEHTDYGLLTILAQDHTGGLEVRGPDGWITVPAEPEVLVVNLGDMLERLSGGRYRSTPHRVRNTGDAERLSFPCFVDPSWDAVCGPDGLRYGDYLTAKVARVFPALRPHLAAGS